MILSAQEIFGHYLLRKCSLFSFFSGSLRFALLISLFQSFCTFVSLFSRYLSIYTQVHSMKSISKLLPDNLNKAQKIARMSRNDFHKYPSVLQFIKWMNAWSKWVHE